MSPPKYRGIRFLHPDLDVGVADQRSLRLASGGLAISPRGSLESVDDRDAVRQALLMLLSTRPGERVMRPTYGCDLHRLLFSPNDETTAGLAIHYVRQAISRWERRVDVLSIDATASEDDGSKLDISIHYRVRSTQESDRISFEMSLAGEGA